MGCFGSKQQYADEEEAISLESEALGFSKCSVTEVDFAIRKYSCDGRINRNQMKSLTTALSLNLKNYDTHIYIDKLISSMELPGCYYDVNPLLVIGIVLAEGSEARKAQSLFEIVDPKESGAMNSSKVQTLLNLWVDLILRLGVLAGDNQNHRSSIEQINCYIERCNQAKDHWIQTMKNALGSGFVPKDHFVRVCSTLKEGEFMKPGGLRMYLAKEALASHEAREIKGRRLSLTQVSEETVRRVKFEVSSNDKT